MVSLRGTSQKDTAILKEQMWLELNPVSQRQLFVIARHTENHVSKPDKNLSELLLKTLQFIPIHLNDSLSALHVHLYIHNAYTFPKSR